MARLVCVKAITVEENMSLLDEAMEPCQFIDKTTGRDTYGGVIRVWKPGAEFDAAIVLDNSTEARIAASEGVKNLYTVTARRNIPLESGQILQRLKSGMYLRLTSDGTDAKTPKSAGLDMRQASAELLEALPT
jgi:hypothetical protein